MSQYILLVEDNKIDTLVHTKIIQMSRPDMKIAHVENGKDAFDFLIRKKEKPVMVLLDLIMPVMDGFDFLKKIAELPEFQDLKIIVLTTSTNQLDRDKATNIFHISDYVVKPLTLDRFKKIAERMEV